MAHMRFGASPDPDDVFMLWGLSDDRVDLRGHTVEVVHAEIAQLNRWAAEGRLELSGLSAAWWPHVAHRYALCGCGGSAGDGYGPVVVARPGDADPWVGPVAVPGLNTTAYMVTRVAKGPFPHVEVPFDDVLDAVLDGRARAGILVHQHQITFKERGLEVAFDAYRWWRTTTELDVLPLGVVAVSTALPHDVQLDAAAILRDSIRAALDERPHAILAAMESSNGLTLAQTERYVSMYVNERTLEWGDEGRLALAELYRLGHEAGLLPSAPRVEFVDAAMEDRDG